MRWKHLRLLFLLLVLIGILLFRMGFLMPNKPSESAFPVRGIDVSHHNGEIDWNRVAKQGITFAYIKATEGSDLRDPRFLENWKEARANGLTVGAYHFFSTLSPGVSQAENFCRTVPRTVGMLPPVIDVEFTAEDSRMTLPEFQTHFQEMSDRLKAHFGVLPVIYTTKEFHADYFARQPIDRLWIRSVFWRPSPLAENWLFWQYSSLGKVDGIAGPVDLNVFRGSSAELTQSASPTDRTKNRGTHFPIPLPAR